MGDQLVAEELKKTLQEEPCISLEMTQNDFRKLFILNFRKLFILSELGDYKEELKKTQLYLAGRTEENPSPCISLEMTQKNFRKLFILSELGDYKEELKKTQLYLAGRTEENPSPCISLEMTQKNFRKLFILSELGDYKEEPFTLSELRND